MSTRHFFFHALFFALFLAVSDVVAAPATIDTSTSAQATTNAAQRKIFFDSENEVHWAFYHNGAAIEYSYSADGTTWTSAGTLPYNTSSFSAVYKTIGGTSYVYVVAEANTYDVALLRGELDEDSVSFDAEIIVFDGTSANNLYKKPTATITENNHLWMSAIKDQGADKIERFHVAVRRSTNLADDDLTALNAETTVGRRIHSLENAVLVSRSGDEVYVVASADDGKIVGYTFNGAQWSTANAGGDYSWFGFAGRYGVNDLVYAIAVSGNEVYIGGSFTNAGGVATADRIAKWDGTSWNALGSGLNNTVHSIAITGSDIYVGGYYTDAGGNGAADYVARWDGHTWNALNNGVNNVVRAIAISGSDIFIGGDFIDAGGDGAADYISRWDGATFNAVGSGLDALVSVITISGSDIYVGGNFTNAGGNGSADFIARWDGATWDALGSGLNNSVTAIAISGSNFYVGGWFTDAGGNGAADYIARWDGATWDALGSALNGAVTAVATSGNDIYAGGNFTNAGGNAAADRIARWDGASWNALDSGLNSYPNAITISGSDVYVGGNFVDAAGIPDADKIAKWNGASWNALSLPTGGLNGTVYDVVISGNDIYVGGDFTDAGGVPEADGIARWDGAIWNALGNGVSGYVSAIAISGNDIYIGGGFTDAGGIANADNIVRWDGSNWNALGSGLNSSVGAIAISGSDIYVGGWFTDAGGLGAADRIARWNGTTWNALGSGISGGAFPRVSAIAISGINVYVGGSFSSAGGVANTLHIARWNGTNWNAVGGGLSSAVYAIAISGSDVYVGGTFQNAGGNANANRIARWNGTTWNALGNGVNNTVNAIAISGSDIYIGGNFAPAGGVTGANSFARWDGSTWNAVGGGLNLAIVNTTVNAIEISSSDIYVGSSIFDAQGFKYPTPLAYYSRAITADADNSTEIAVTSDTTGNIYLTYTNEDDEVKFRRFDNNDSEWKGAVTLNATASSSPSITYNNSDGRLFASWTESNAVTYRHALTPYQAADWKIKANLYNIGTNAFASAVANQEIPKLQLLWTNGNANPYSVYADVINMSALTVAISSGASNSTNISPIPVTFQFDKPVTGFVVGDITVGNGSAGNFVAVDEETYTADITPNGQGAVIVNVAAGVATDSFDNDNTVATQLSRTYDTTAPTVVISSGVSSPTNTSPIATTFQFSETVTGFVVGDITVGNGTAGSFVAVDGDTYTANLTPTGHGSVTVDVAGSVAVDAAGNNNVMATQLSRFYDNTVPTVNIDDPGVAVNLNNHPSFALTGSCSENTRTVAVNADSSGGGAAVSATPTCSAGAWNASLNLSALEDGTVTVIANHQDAVGLNALQTSRSITKKTTSPTALLSSTAPDPTSASSIPLAIEFSETVTGFVAADLTVTNAAVTSFSAIDGNSYTATLTPSSNATVTARVTAGKVQDVYGNDNSATAQLSRVYAVVEEEDEEDEEQIETQEYCSVWNGFFNSEQQPVWNILEHVNSAETELLIKTTLYGFDGLVKSSTQFTLGAGQQLDLLVHEMQGWQSDSYGLVCSKVKGVETAKDLDGRMVYYRRNTEGEAEGNFEYVFASAFNQGFAGEQHVGFNTYQPSLHPADSENFVANWIQVTNLENQVQRGELLFYSQGGERIETKQLEIPARGQSDNSAHDFGPTTVGFVRWKPDNDAAKFIVKNTRYLYDNSKLENRFDGVFQVQATTGSRGMLSAILDTASASSILEVANITDQPRSLVVKFYDSEGEQLAKLNFTLPAFGSQHVIADGILNQGTGSVTVEGSGDERKSVLATVFQYGRKANGGVAYLYAVEALRPVGDVMVSSYNTYLNQDCDLYLANASDSTQSATISMQRSSGTEVFANHVITLEPKQSIVSNLCAAENKESYGMVRVVTQAEQRLNSYLLRRDRGGSYRYPIAVR